MRQIDISDDGFLSLMNDDGDLKDDVRMPDGEIGDKINKLFKVEEKDTSELLPCAWPADGHAPTSMLQVWLTLFPSRRYHSHLHG